MKYFKLRQDNRIPYGVLLTGINKIGGYFESKKGDLSALDRAIASYVNSSPVNFYPDILDRQIYMIRGVVKEVFDLFLPDLEYKHCCLLDNPNNRYDIYYIPVLDVLELQEGAAQGRHIFRIAQAKEIEVAVSLDVVEAVLRRSPTGIRISPLNITREK